MRGDSAVPAPIKRPQNSAYYTLASTLDKYEVQEISFRLAANLLNKPSDRRPNLVVPPREVEPVSKPAAIRVVDWNPLVRCGYEVEEIEPNRLADWTASNTNVVQQIRAWLGRSPLASAKLHNHGSFVAKDSAICSMDGTSSLKGHADIVDAPY
jgi:hypothetical protein